MLIQRYTDRSWGLVHTRSRCEKMVGTFLAHSGLPIYIPCVYKTRTRERVSKLPMFQGYLFAAWNVDERGKLGACSGIADYLETPLQCDDELIQQLALLARLEELSKSQVVTLQKMPALVQPARDSFSGIPGAWQEAGGERVFSVSMSVMGLPLNAAIAGNCAICS